MDFRGPNLYLIAPGEIVGATFGDTVVGLENARPIGLMMVDGTVELNPDRDTVIDASHRLIVIADDDSPPVRSSRPRRAIASLSRPPAAPQPAQHVLMIGWNPLGRHLLEELESTAAAGSAVEVVYDTQLVDEGDVDVSFCRRLAVRSTPSTSAMWHLGDDAEIARLTSIVLLGYRTGLSPGEADSRTLLNLLAIKRELVERGLAPRVVVQLLDVDSADLAPPTGPDDFVISDAIGSRLIAQMADQPARRSVLLRLYSGDGSAIQLVDPAALGRDDRGRLRRGRRRGILARAVGDRLASRRRTRRWNYAQPPRRRANADRTGGQDRGDRLMAERGGLGGRSRAAAVAKVASGRDRLEVVTTLLLAVAAVATAWASYQATRWNGEQARAGSRTTALRIDAARAAGLAAEQTQVDVALFIQWIDATANNDAELEDFYVDRFRPEFKTASIAGSPPTRSPPPARRCRRSPSTSTRRRRAPRRRGSTRPLNCRRRPSA